MNGADVGCSGTRPRPFETLRGFRRCLPDRDRFPGQKRLVHGEVDRTASEWRSPARDLPRRGRGCRCGQPRARQCAGEFPRGSRGRAGWTGRATRRAHAPLRDCHDDEDEAEEHQGIGRFAHDEVEAARGHEHEKHRLADDIKGDGEEPALLLRGQLVRSFLLQPATLLRPENPPRSRRPPACSVWHWSCGLLRVRAAKYAGWG